MKYLESHGFWRFVLVAILVSVTVIAFWPSPVDAPVQGQLASVLSFLHDHGLSLWINYHFVEASAHIMLFIPLGLVATLAFPKKYWWQIGILGFILSACMELGQLLYLHNRFASPLDVVTITAGAVIGALLSAFALAVAGPPLISRGPAAASQTL